MGVSECLISGFVCGGEVLVLCGSSVGCFPEIGQTVVWFVGCPGGIGAHTELYSFSVKLSK